MALVVLFPAFELVDLDETLVNDFIAIKNLLAVLGDVENIFLRKFKVIFCTFVEVSGFSYEHSAHLIGHVLLSAIETSECSIGCKSLPLHELD